MGKLEETENSLRDLIEEKDKLQEENNECFINITKLAKIIKDQEQEILLLRDENQIKLSELEQ